MLRFGPVRMVSINAVRSTSNGRYAELEFKLRERGEGHFLNLTARSSLTLVDAGFEKKLFYATRTPFEANSFSSVFVSFRSSVEGFGVRRLVDDSMPCCCDTRTIRMDFSA